MNHTQYPFNRLISIAPLPFSEIFVTDVPFHMEDQTEEPRYVTAVGLDDVQLGRGRPVVTSEGNQRFRTLILQYKPEYSSCNRHAHKDVVARTILSIISCRGGRFLRKIESRVERKKLAIEDGVDAWEVADKETSISLSRINVRNR